jgi:hypothetical protein
VAVEVFDGNTADPATLSAQVENLKDRFAISRVVLVGDRGMITSARICRNRELTAERARKREELLAATERELLRIQAQVRRRNSPLRSAAEIGMAVGDVVNGRKMAKHFAVEIRDGHFAFRRRTQQIEQ